MKVNKEHLLKLLEEKPRHERIAYLRSLYRLSQAGLANVAGVLRGTVSTWEAPTHGTEDGRGHEPGRIARNRMSAFFELPAYVFSDEWGYTTREKRSQSPSSGHREPQPVSPVIQLPAAGVRRIKG